MSNTLQNLMNTMIMPMALPVLREACVLPALVNQNYSGVFAEQNEVLRIPKPQNLGPAQDFDQVNGSTSTDLGDDAINVTLDSWKYKQFEMNDKEMREVITSGVLPSAADAAVKSLANAVDLDLWALYKDIPYYAGTPNTLPTSTAEILDIRKVMNDNLAPWADRSLALNTGAETAYLKNVAQWLQTGPLSTSALREAFIGRLHGYNFYTDQLAMAHTFGSAVGDTLAIGGGSGTVGATAITITGSSGTKTLKHGDIFTVAGVSHADGTPITFVVKADVAAVSGTFANVPIYPKLPSAVADTTGIVFVTGGGGKTIAPQSIAFHRDAFMFAARPLVPEPSEISTISVQTDPVSGIPLRLETWRDPKLAKRMWRFDILYGVKTIREEFAARAFG